MYPIDIVYTWCEQSHKAFKPKQKLNNGNNRFNDNGELRYSIRSIYRYAPWVRQIFIVVDDTQRPSWLHPRAADANIPVRLVKHSDIIPVKYLPTYNSQCIELYLCNIPDLAEHFVYFNDDMFIGNTVQPSDFFNDQGFPKYYFNGYIPKINVRTMHAHAWKNNQLVIHSIFGPKCGISRTPEHQALPMLKSTCAELLQAPKWPILNKFIENTSVSRFRQTNNIYFIGLCVYYNILRYKGHGIVGIKRSIYIGINGRSKFFRILNRLERKQPVLFCLNDVSQGKQWYRIHQGLSIILNRLFNFKTIVEDWSVRRGSATS